MVVQCQICNEFSEGSVYVLETDTIVQARVLALEKLKQNCVHHVNIYSKGTSTERVHRIIPILPMGKLSITLNRHTSFP